MISRQKIIKESEFKWIIESGNSELIQRFLENRAVFIKNISLDSIEGRGILKFLKSSKNTGLIYIDFRIVRNGLNQETKLFDKIYFQNSDDLKRFESSFSDDTPIDNVIKVFEE